MAAVNLFIQLCHHYHAEPDRRGEVHVPCPWCGKEPKRSQVHFSFNEREWYGHCFVCGNGAYLHHIARHIGLDGANDYEPPQPPQPKPEVHYPWMDRAEAIVQWMATRPKVVAGWQWYKPLSEYDIIAHRLGLGVLPSSRCHHLRLIVPMVNFDGKIVGLRGRAVSCDCGKWLSSAGSKPALFNWQVLGTGQIVFLVENAIDALLLTARTPAVGLATLSTSYWRDEWRERLEAAKTRKIVIAYDNHWQGQGTHKERWIAAHPGVRPPLPAAVRLQARLRGLPVVLYDWGDAPHGTDIGDILNT